MYVVRRKDGGEVIHVNRAPLRQKLSDQAVYHAFDAKTMEIGRWDGPVLPEDFRIDKKGRVVPLTLEERVAAGKVELPPGHKVVGGEVVEQTLAEKVEGGLVTLEPYQKVEGERVVEKSAAELVEEGLVSREDVREGTLRRLRRETAEHFEEARTETGYSVDALARQKASLSLVFRHLPGAEEKRDELLAAGLIYPDEILDEIVAEIGEVQAAYREEKEALDAAFEAGEPVDRWEGASVRERRERKKKEKKEKKDKGEKEKKEKDKKSKEEP